MTHSPRAGAQPAPSVVLKPLPPDFLADVAAHVAPEPDLRRAAEALLRMLAQATGAARGSILTVDPDNGRLVVAAGVGLPAELVGRECPPRPRGISDWVVRERRGVILNGEIHDQRFEGTAHRDGIESAVCLPLLHRGVPAGVLNLARLTPAPRFADSDRAALENVLRPAAAALVRLGETRSALRSQARQSARASASGSAYLPEGHTDLAQVEMVLAYRASPRLAGDRCERVAHAGGEQSLLALDVAGAGAEAAAAGGFLQGMFVTLAQPERSAAGMAARLNAELCSRFGEPRIAAAWIGQLGRRGEIAYCSAGHAPAFWVPTDGGPVIRLDRGGPVLGAVAEARYDEEQLRLLPGDLLVVASDGVLAARDPGDEPYGADRLAERLRELRHQSVDALARAVCEDVMGFTGRPSPGDDLTLLVLRHVTSR